MLKDFRGNPAQGPHGLKTNADFQAVRDGTGKRYHPDIAASQPAADILRVAVSL